MGLMHLGIKVRNLEDSIANLQATIAVESRPARPQTTVSGARIPVADLDVSVASAGTVLGSPSTGSQDVTRIDDHLWSEDGRQAIGDVLEEREEVEQERRSERWQQMMQYRTDRAVLAVSDELNLTDEESEHVTTLVNAFMEVRSHRWQQMNSGDDTDFEEIELEYEEAREEIEQELIDVIGEEGVETLRNEMRGGHGWN